MVTYISKKNAQLYRVLFDKAAQKIRNAKPNELNAAVAQYFGEYEEVPSTESFSNSEVYYIKQNDEYILQENLLQFENGVTYYTKNDGWDNFAIGSLNEYYAYLESLLSISTSDEEKAFYVRLPLDEDVFAINADSRVISVPASFARNGIGVQGDEMAEVLYFTIDRYFDATDLAGSEINIAIQWEAKNASKETITGFSRNFGKDIESIPGKIIFGWPISSELTQTSGNIKFAVRFYTLNSDNETYAYSFATLPAEITVNATLNYDVNDTSKEIDHGAEIISRIRSDGIYNSSMPTPGAPTITVSDITGNDKVFVVNNPSIRIIDLPEGNAGVDLAISAQPTASSDGTNLGVIGYKWKRYNYDNGSYSSTPVLVESGISEDYIKMTTTLNQDYIYYKKNGNVYEVVPTMYIDDFEYDIDEEGYSVNSEYIPLYKKVSKANVKTTGIYTVDVKSKVLANTTTKTMDLIDGITVPGPLTPVVEVDAENTTLETDGTVMAHILVGQTGSATMSVNAVAGEEGKDASEVGAEPNVGLTYAWQDVTSGSPEVITGANSDSLLVEEIVNEDVDNLYQAVVTSSRNGVTTSATSGLFRLTAAPKKPVIQVREIQGSDLVWVNKSYDSENNGNQIIQTRRSGTSTLVIGVSPETKHDTFSYIWMKVNNDNEADYDASGTKLQIDLATDGEVVEGLTNSILDYFDGDKTGNADTIEQALSFFSSTITDESGTRYQSDLVVNEPGIYYCVVINNLNNHINVNASPFFIVS